MDGFPEMLLPQGHMSVVYFSIIGYFSFSITRHPLHPQADQTWVCASWSVVCLGSLDDVLPYQPEPDIDWSSQQFFYCPSLGLPQDYYFPEEPCRRATYKAPAPHLHWAHLHLPAFVFCLSGTVGISQLLTLISFIDCILPGDVCWQDLDQWSAKHLSHLVVLPGVSAFR